LAVGVLGKTDTARIRSPSLSSTTSPRWMPTRNSMRRSGGRPALHSIMPFCISTQVTLESLIADAEAARAKAMAEKGGASAAVSALIAKAKLSGMWREKPELTKSGPVTVNVVWLNAN
jgi:hypothetical protein